MVKKLVLISSLVLSVALSSGVVYGEEALNFGYDHQVESMLNVAGVLDVEYVSGAGHLGYDSVDYSLDRLQLDNTSYISAVIAKSLGLYGELVSIYDFKSGKLSEYTRDSRDISSAKRGDLLIFNDRIAFYLGNEDGKPMILYAADDIRGVVKEEAPTDIDVIVDTQLYIESGKFKYIGKPEVIAREVRNAVKVDSSESQETVKRASNSGSSSSIDGFMDAFEPIKNPVIQYEENVDKGIEDSNKGVQRKNKSWINKLFGE